MKKKTKSRVDSGTKKGTIRFVQTDVIKGRRERLGLTVREAAAKAGFSTHVQWMKIESGTNADPQISTLMKIASVLRMSPATLLRKP